MEAWKTSSLTYITNKKACFTWPLSTDCQIQQQPMIPQIGSLQITRANSWCKESSVRCLPQPFPFIFKLAYFFFFFPICISNSGHFLILQFLVRWAARAALRKCTSEMRSHKHAVTFNDIFTHFSKCRRYCGVALESPIASFNNLNIAGP